MSTTVDGPGGSDGEKGIKNGTGDSAATPCRNPNRTADAPPPDRGAECGAGIAPSGSVPASCAVFKRCKAQAVYQGAAGE